MVMMRVEAQASVEAILHHETQGVEEEDVEKEEAGAEAYHHPVKVEVEANHQKARILKRGRRVRIPQMRL